MVPPAIGCRTHSQKHGTKAKDLKKQLPDVVEFRRPLKCFLLSKYFLGPNTSFKKAQGNLIITIRISSSFTHSHPNVYIMNSLNKTFQSNDIQPTQIPTLPMDSSHWIGFWRDPSVKFPSHLSHTKNRMVDYNPYITDWIYTLLELTYPIKNHFWVDGFPFPFRWDM